MGGAWAAWCCKLRSRNSVPAVTATSRTPPSTKYPEVAVSGKTTRSTAGWSLPSCARTPAMRCTLAAYSPLVGRIWAMARRGMAKRYMFRQAMEFASNRTVIIWADDSYSTQRGRSLFHVHDRLHHIGWYRRDSGALLCTGDSAEP